MGFPISGSKKVLPKVGRKRGFKQSNQRGFLTTSDRGRNYLIHIHMTSLSLCCQACIIFLHKCINLYSIPSATILSDLFVHLVP